jgi:hypothetical protein
MVIQLACQAKLSSQPNCRRPIGGVAIVLGLHCIETASFLLSKGTFHYLTHVHSLPAPPLTGAALVLVAHEKHCHSSHFVRRLRLEADHTFRTQTGRAVKAAAVPQGKPSQRRRCTRELGNEQKADGNYSLFFSHGDPPFLLDKPSHSVGTALVVKAG